MIDLLTLLATAKERVQVYGGLPLLNSLIGTDFDASVHDLCNKNVALDILLEGNNTILDNSIISSNPSDDRYEQKSDLDMLMLNAEGLNDPIDSSLSSNKKRDLKQNVRVQQMIPILPFYAVRCDNITYTAMRIDGMIPEPSAYRLLAGDEKIAVDKHLNYQFSAENIYHKQIFPKPTDENLTTFTSMYDRETKTNISLSVDAMLKNKKGFTHNALWGLVFNRKGQMLIQKRSEFAKDNKNLWDKAIGGYILDQDKLDRIGSYEYNRTETIETLEKKLFEEILNRDNNIHHHKINSANIAERGLWPGYEALESSRYMKTILSSVTPSQITIFSLPTIHLQSGRVIEEKIVPKKINVSPFIVILPEKEGLEKQYIDNREDLKFIDTRSLHYIFKDQQEGFTNYTPDLEIILENPLFYNNIIYPVVTSLERTSKLQSLSEITAPRLNPYRSWNSKFTSSPRR